jgi:hypothetical protein
MKIKTIAYAMLRSTALYENDRVEVIVEVDEKDNLGDVVRRAKRVCEAALKTDPKPVATFESLVGDDKMDDDPFGREPIKATKKRSRDRW